MQPEKRRRVPLKIQLEVALRQLGLDPKTAQLDHNPALARRRINPVTGEHIPHQHDPSCLEWLDGSVHKVKTAVDIREIRKTDRLVEKQIRHEHRRDERRQSREAQ